MFIIQSSDLSQTVGCDLEQNGTGVIMKGKGPHCPQYSYDIIRVHSLLVYSDNIEYNIVGDTELPNCVELHSSSKYKVEI